MCSPCRNRRSTVHCGNGTSTDTCQLQNWYMQSYSAVYYDHCQLQKWNILTDHYIQGFAFHKNIFTSLVRLFMFCIVQLCFRAAQDCRVQPGRIIANDLLGRIWKETIVGYLKKFISIYHTGLKKKNDRSISKDNRIWAENETRRIYFALCRFQNSRFYVVINYLYYSCIFCKEELLQTRFPWPLHDT